MRTQSTRVKEMEREKIDVFGSKKLLLFSITSFIAAIFIFRLFSALQRAGIVGSPNIIGDFHFHHWAIALIVMPVVIIFAFVYRDNKNAWGISMVILSFLTGMFVDGIVYYDSAIFFEENVVELQPITISDVWFLTFLGMVWMSLIFTIIILQINEVNVNLKKCGMIEK